MAHNNFNRTAIKTSTTYTVSLDIKSTVASTIGLTGLVNGNATNYMTNSTTTINGTINANEWNHVVFTCTTISDFSGITVGFQVIYFNPGNNLLGTGVTTWIKNVKLEEGNTETNWIPNEADALYTKLGYDKALTTDVSGFGYNGTQSGTLTFNIDSPRYMGSTDFNTGLINSSVGAMLAVSKDFTINGWFYYKSGTSYYASAENYHTSVCLENARYFVYNSSGTPYVGKWTNTANVWQMVTLVHDSVAKILKLYVNGNYVNGIITSGDINSNKTLNIGGRQNTASFIGSVSDIRIYCTALSAEDILKLYEISGIIDNKGNTYSYEFIEED